MPDEVVNNESSRKHIARWLGQEIAVTQSPCFLFPIPPTSLPPFLDTCVSLLSFFLSSFPLLNIPNILLQAERMEQSLKLGSLISRQDYASASTLHPLCRVRSTSKGTLESYRSLKLYSVTLWGDSRKGNFG
jgi:hypothetical protein